MNISFEIHYETSNSALIICEFLSIHSKLSISTYIMIDNPQFFLNKWAKRFT